MPPGPGRRQSLHDFGFNSQREIGNLNGEAAPNLPRPLHRTAACQVLLSNFKFKLNKPVQLH